MFLSMMLAAHHRWFSSDSWLLIIGGSLNSHGCSGGVFLSTRLAASRFCFKSEFVASSTQWRLYNFGSLFGNGCS